MAVVEHFEIPVDDIRRAQAFYESALGFQYEPWGAEMGMLNQPEGKGINGDLHQRGALTDEEFTAAKARLLVDPEG